MSFKSVRAAGEKLQAEDCLWVFTQGLQHTRSSEFRNLQTCMRRRSFERVDSMSCVTTPASWVSETRQQRTGSGLGFLQRSGSNVLPWYNISLRRHGVLSFCMCFTGPDSSSSRLGGSTRCKTCWFGAGHMLVTAFAVRSDFIINNLIVIIISSSNNSSNNMLSLVVRLGPFSGMFARQAT